MRARAVIGASFGDEGKGLFVDYLCSQGAGVVVRFNGGAQAGHTVVTPGGKRHVFSHVGSGTFLGVPTLLSQFFVCNPLLFLRELDELTKLGAVPQVFASPDCLVTTFGDMVINQRIEDKLGAKRHGSVGVGFNETHVRSGNDSLKITMADLWNRTPIRDKLAEICGKYAKFRTGSPIEDPDKMIAAFEYACEETAARIHPGGIGQCAKLDPVFEGAQGLLLSHDNKEFFPHVTRSATGMTNVRTLCAQAGIEKIEGYYISRTYLTRHGAGPLPGEDPGLKYADNTNVPHSYQGRLRFAKLDSNALLHRIEKDWGGPGAKLVLTHCDQEDAPFRGDFMSHGPKRTDVQKVTR